MIRSSACLALMAGYALLASPAAAQAGESAPPRFERKACESQGAAAEPGAQVLCGTIAVPRIVSDPASGIFRLNVTVLKGSTSAADAIIFVPGGPGEGSPPPSAYPQLVASFPDRDIILFDPRGTGNSEPRLCADTNIHGANMVAPMFTPTQLHATLSTAIAACLAEGERAGMKPAEFSSRANAEDIDLVRRALGYEKLSIIGTSYGAVTTLQYAANRPQAVRAVVLNSPAIGTLSILSGPENWARARQAMFAECQEDTLCSAAYPELGVELDRVLAMLLERPLSVPMPEAFGAAGNLVLLDAIDFERLLLAMSYDRATVAMIPALVRSVGQGSTDAVAEALQSVASNFTSVAAFPHFAVLCQDGTAMHEANMLSGTEASSAATNFALVAPACGAWAGSDQTPDLPTGTGIPTILLTGLLDPVIPPANARRIGPLLVPNVRAFEFSSMGHPVTPQSRCGIAITQQFLADPSARIDVNCLASEPPVAFRGPR